MAEYFDEKQLQYDSADMIRCLVEVIPRDLVEQDTKNPASKRIQLFFDTAKSILESEKHSKLFGALSEIVEIEARTQLELNQRVGEGKSQIWPIDKVEEELNGEFFVQQFADYLMVATSLVVLKENRGSLSIEAMEEVSEDVKDEFNVDDGDLIPPTFYENLSDQYVKLLLADARKISDFCGTDQRGALNINKEAILKSLKIVDSPFPTWTLS